MSIRFKKVDRRSSVYGNVKKLYHTAFPADEQVPFWFLMLRARRDHVDFYSVFDENKWVGFVYMIGYRDITYVYYLAISDKERGSGYGSKILKTITKKCSGRRIILIIEPVDKKAGNYEERVKRKKFYEKNGFRNLNYTVVEKNVVYQAFGYGQAVSKEEYNSVIRDYFGKILFRVYCRDRGR